MEMNQSVLTRTHIEQAITETLSQFVGGKGLPVKVLAHELGVSNTLIYRWMDSADHMLPTSIQWNTFLALVPEARDTFGAKMGWAQGHGAEDHRAVVILADALAALAKAMEDGEFDAAEYLANRPMFETARRMLNGFHARFEGGLSEVA